MELHPCSGCRRHIRVDDESCRFCATRVVAPVARVGRVTELTRAAIFAGAATLAGCYVDSTTPKSDPPPPPDAVVPVVAIGQIRGTVRNPAKEPLPGVHVFLRDSNDNQSTVAADEDGNYVFAKLAPGHYTVWVQQPAVPTQLRPIDLAERAVEHVDLIVHPPVPRDYGPCCMPYGAPPARRRAV